MAHHSGARYVASARHLDTELAAFTYRQSALADALTVADQTAGPNGKLMTVDERLDDMLSRHGPDSHTAAAHPRREPYIHAATHRVVHDSKQPASTSTCYASGNRSTLRHRRHPEPAHVFLERPGRGLQRAVRSTRRLGRQDPARSLA